MTDQIERLIEEGALEAAMAQILLLEARAEGERSRNARTVLFRRVNRLKKKYADRRIAAQVSQTPDLPPQRTGPPDLPDVDRLRSSLGTGDRVFLLEGATGGRFESGGRVGEARIEGCRGISVSSLSVEGSAVLLDVADSEIAVSARQIRLIGCRNLALAVRTETGVFLQESSGITIRRLDAGGDLPVFDFSDPCGAGNYAVL